MYSSQASDMSVSPPLSLFVPEADPINRHLGHNNCPCRLVDHQRIKIVIPCFVIAQRSDVVSLKGCRMLAVLEGETSPNVNPFNCHGRLEDPEFHTDTTCGKRCQDSKGGRRALVTKGVTIYTPPVATRR